MKSIINLALLIALTNTLNVCENCVDSNCNFNCTGLQCQAFSYTPACAKQGCVGGFCCPSTFYISYSSQSMNYTYCVACNYTFPGCVGCSFRDFCTQCQPQYILQGGICLNLNGTPAQSVPSWFGLWIAFVVLFGVFSAGFVLLRALKYSRGKQLNDSPSLSSDRRATQMTKPIQNTTEI